MPNWEISDPEAAFDGQGVPEKSINVVAAIYCAEGATIREPKFSFFCPFVRPSVCPQPLK